MFSYIFNGDYVGGGQSVGILSISPAPFHTNLTLVFTHCNGAESRAEQTLRVCCFIRLLLIKTEWRS